MEILWLSRNDVDTLGLTPAECMGLVEKALNWHADGLLEVPPKLGIHPPKGRHIHAMPAFIPPLGAAGLKWVADFPGNKAAGLPTVHALIVLNDAETGAPVCVMEGGAITAWRTAAMTGVALRVCALPDSRVATIVGTGVEAQSHALMLPAVLPTLEEIRIVGRDLAAATRFCARPDLQIGIRLVPFGDRQSAVSGSQVIVTVTNSVKTRLLEPDWIAPGSTVAVLDNGGKETTLLYSMDRVIVDDLRPFASEEVRARFAAGLPRIDGELGQILKGRLAGRSNSQDRVLILNLGMGACDLVIAAEVYRRALASARGVTLKL